jgi:serine/threonine protein kinase
VISPPNFWREGQSRISTSTIKVGYATVQRINSSIITCRVFLSQTGSLLRGAGIFLSLIELVVPALVARYSMEVDDIAVFIDFLYHMLIIDPKNRRTARDLLNHPWVADVE